MNGFRISGRPGAQIAGVELVVVEAQVPTRGGGWRLASCGVVDLAARGMQERARHSQWGVFRDRGDGSVRAAEGSGVDNGAYCVLCREET